ncbi:MAG: RidA family protein [Phycisphaerales bacterium]|nr:RidA family protein [Phycisphaerales bacterium]
MSASESLKRMCIVLPTPPKPVAAYVPFVRHDGLVFTSGQIPLENGVVRYTGKVGRERSLEEAQAAARLCAINALAVGAEAAGGIDAITRVLKVTLFVASAEGFTDQHKVANGASEFLVEVFGGLGRHARAAVGVAELPMNATTEIDVVFAIQATAAR